MPLPNEADPLVPELRQRITPPRRQRFRIKVYCTACWGVQRSKQMQQRTFPRT